VNTASSYLAVLKSGHVYVADASDFMDTDVLDAHLDSVSRSEACDVNHFDSAFTNAFLKTDEEFGKVRLLIMTALPAPVHSKLVHSLQE
jgi:hypothetical protein